MDLLAFKCTWIDASRQKDRSDYVTHFNDLCQFLGVAKPLDADPAGDIYGFEKGSKSAGGEERAAHLWLAAVRERIVTRSSIFDPAGCVAISMNVKGDRV